MINKKDCSGQIINQILLNRRIDDYVSPGGRHHKIARYNCTCLICNRNVDMLYPSIKNRKYNGCGCERDKNFIPKPRLIKDITGQRFGYCVAIERLSNGKWLCLCDCGKTFSATLSHLKSGHTKSCGCYRENNRSRIRFIDLTGQKFGELTVIKYLGRFEANTGYHVTKWLCLCSCGSYVIVTSRELRSGDTKSCGCIGASYREKCIRNWLKEHNVSFVTEYTFDDLKLVHRLRFDFAIMKEGKLIGLIEHQGRQHFEEYSKTTKMGKQQRDVTDQMKVDYCKEHNIPLYQIRFDEDLNESLTRTLAELHVDTVPSLLA